VATSWNSRSSSSYERPSPFKATHWNAPVPKKMSRLFIYFFIGLIMLNGCSKYHGEKWIATQDMQVFAEPNDDRTNPIFLIKKGEICTPLKDSMAKIYAYTQVQCISGTGWILDDFFDKSSK
jgi:hypothetical protein